MGRIKRGSKGRKRIRLIRKPSPRVHGFPKKSSSKQHLRPYIRRMPEIIKTRQRQSPALKAENLQQPAQLERSFQILITHILITPFNKYYGSSLITQISTFSKNTVRTQPRTHSQRRIKQPFSVRRGKQSLQLL